MSCRTVRCDELGSSMDVMYEIVREMTTNHLHVPTHHYYIRSV